MRINNPITKKQLYELFLLLVFLGSSKSFSILSELSRLQQSLQKLTPFLSEASSASRVTPINIKKVVEIAQKALKEKNLGPFDSLEKTIVVVVAKQLIDYILKEKLSGQNMPQRVSAILEVVQQVIEQYQDKSSFNYVFVTRDESFLNEELFTKAFQFAGYKNLTLAYMNHNLPDVQKLLNENSRLQKIFSLKQDDPDKAYVVTTKVYDYISSINNYKKNQLFLMLFQKGGLPIVYNEESLKKIVQPNFLRFQKEHQLDIYLPYAKEDFFVTLRGARLTPVVQDSEIKRIKNIINNLTGNQEELIIILFCCMILYFF